MLPERFTRIDETNRGGHRYVHEADRCIFFGEYFAGQGYSGGPTNQLIFNYKAKPSVIANNPARLRHKSNAIGAIAAGLRNAINRKSIEEWTWVPVPPSKVLGHPDYCDRLYRTLQIAFNGYDADVRLLLRQTTSTTPDHEAATRSSFDDLLSITEVDQSQLGPALRSKGIVLFDDVLTSGKHFRVCHQRVREFLPHVGIMGVFVARCIHADPAFEFEDLDA